MSFWASGYQQRHYTYMKKRYLPFSTSLKTDYPDLTFLFGMEGEVFFFAKKQDKYYVLADFGTRADMLDEEDSIN